MLVEPKLELSYTLSLTNGTTATAVNLATLCCVTQVGPKSDKATSIKNNNEWRPQKHED